MLNKYEQIKLDTISKLVSKEIKIKEAMELLNLTERQIYRLKKIFKENGKNGFIHRNRGKSSPRKIDSLIIEQIKDLYLSEYYDFNFEHFYEDVICGQFDISYNTMLKAFIDDDIISPLAHKKTVQKYKEKMESLIKEKNINEEINDKIKLIKSRIIETEKAHTRRSSNLYVFGQEVQMDACEKYWFGGIVSYLHLAVDKATKKVLFGWFEYEEITRGYYVLLFHIIINYGIPDKIKADNKSTFSANNAKDKSKKNFMTQFGKVCERLNITLYTTSSSTSKANVERENETFKNRLIAELRHENINTIDEANDYLNNVFIPKINKRFSYAINEKTSLMKPNPYTEDELKLVISERKDKIIDNASSISYNCKYYIPINPETGEVTCFMKGTKCILIINYDGEYWSEIEGHYYQMIEIENRDSTMKKESEITDSKIKKKQHKYIPPKNHPWRKNMMLK